MHIPTGNHLVHAITSARAARSRPDARTRVADALYDTAPDLFDSSNMYVVARWICDLADCSDDGITAAISFFAGPLPAWRQWALLQAVRQAILSA